MWLFSQVLGINWVRWWTSKIQWKKWRNFSWSWTVWQIKNLMEKFNFVTQESGEFAKDLVLCLLNFSLCCMNLNVWKRCCQGLLNLNSEKEIKWSNLLETQVNWWRKCRISWIQKCSSKWEVLETSWTWWNKCNRTGTWVKWVS